MASSYKKALYYCPKEITAKGVYIPYIWVTVYDCTPQLCVTVFVTTLHYQQRTLPVKCCL